MKNKKAFTLIELLIVIAIIGILSSVVLVGTNTAREKARLVKVLSTMKSIEPLANSCVIEGGGLVIPASNGSGGTAICTSGGEVLPSLAGTDFTYCGNGCGGWASSPGVYHAISAYSDTYSGGRKAIVCGSNVDVSGWYAGGSSFDFRGISTCKTFGF